MKAAAEKAEKNTKAAVKKADDKAVAEVIEAKKTAVKAKQTVKKAEQKAEQAVRAAKTPAKKIAAAKLNLVIQSKMGGSISAEEIAAKIPKNATNAYVKVEENKIYWTTADDAGSVDIW